MVRRPEWSSDFQGLVTLLRGAGFSVGIGEQLKLFRLIKMLEGRELKIKSPEALANWFSPLICTRGDQLSRLTQALSVYFPDGARGRQGSVPLPRQSGWSQLFPLLSVVVGVVGLVAALLYAARPGISLLLETLTSLGSSGTPVTTKAGSVSSNQAGNADAILRVLSMAVPALLALVAIGYRRGRVALRHAQVVGGGSLIPVQVTPLADDSENPRLLRSSRILNRPVERRTRRLNIALTIKASAAAAGRFLPIFAVQRVQPNWMLLVERGGPEDPLPAFGERLSRLFGRTRVRHTLYEFRRSPAWVQQPSINGDGPLTPIERAIGTDRPTRVLILGEAARLLDTAGEGPARWLVESDFPAVIVLLTPKRREEWGNAESKAAQAGVIVLPADADGLAGLARKIQADELVPDALSGSGEELLESLQEDRFTWLSQIEPETRKRKELVATLRQSLIATDFKLLVGVAAFPEVRLDLMSTIDAALFPTDSASVQRARFISLGRLVWLKESFFPEWLRIDLLSALPSEELRQVREAWNLVLSRRVAENAQEKMLKIHLSGAPSGDSTNGDGLFLDFIRGKFDLPAPVRFARLASWWRAPDRTEVTIALGGLLVAGLLAAIRGDIPILLDAIVARWLALIGTLRDVVMFLGMARIGPYASIAELAILLGSIVVFFLRVHERLPAYSGGTQGRLVAMSLAGIALICGWIGLAFVDGPGAIGIDDLSAPLIIAAASLIVLLLPAITREYEVDAWSVIERGRGAGLSDVATVVSLSWLFMSGAVIFLNSPDLLLESRSLIWGWTRTLAQALIAASLLGFLRLLITSGAGAVLQAGDSAASKLLVKIVPSLAAGFVVGLAIRLTIATQFDGLLPSPSAPLGVELANWHLLAICGTIGGATALAISAVRAGLSVDLRSLIYGAGASVFLHGLQLFLAGYPVNVGDTLNLSGVFAFFPLAPIAVVVAGLSLGRIDRVSRWIVAAAIALFGLCSGVALLSFRTNFSFSVALLAAPTCVGAIVSWPLLQRSLSAEPPIIEAPSGFRAQTASRALWIVAPLVLLTMIKARFGAFAVDLTNLVLPLAVFLGWKFGLRGWRLVVLMILPAFWITIPAWLVPPTFDAAATALLLASLFARPDLLSQICKATDAPLWGRVLLVMGLCLQVIVSFQFMNTGSTKSSEALQLTVGQSVAPNSQRIPESPFGTQGPVPPTSQQESKQAPFISDSPFAGAAEDAAAQFEAKRKAGLGAQAAPIAPPAQPTTATPPRSSASVPQATWVASMFVVFSLFLIGLSRLGMRGLWIVVAVAVVGGISYSIDHSIIANLPIQPVPATCAFAGVAAYVCGQAVKIAPFMVREDVIGRAFVVLGSIVLLILAWFAGTLSTLEIGPSAGAGSEAAQAFAIIASWTAGLWLADQRIMFGIAGTSLVILGLANLWTASIPEAPSQIAQILQLMGVKTSSLFGAIFAMFLPSVSFAVGGSCWRAVQLALIEAEAALPKPVEAKVVAKPNIAERPPIVGSERRDVQADNAPPTGPGKRIVILIDGPGMGPGDNASNVLKLYMSLRKGSPDQIVYYVSGAGTSAQGAWTMFQRSVRAVVSIVTGALDDEILASYKFLVNNYQVGDEIYLFGFGAGAYAARSVAGLVHKIGLISSQQLDQAEAGLVAYKKIIGDGWGDENPSFEEANRFARAFATKRPTIKFIGVWDTVAPVMIARPDRMYWPSLEPLAFTSRNSSVRIFRQAVSIVERRGMFRPSRWAEPQEFRRSSDEAASAEPQDILQVWFAGVHADVGGGYSEGSSGISKFPLIWMIEEASKSGLKVDREEVQQLAWGVLRRSEQLHYVGPDIRGEVHDSLFASWRLLEYLPKSAKYREWPGRSSFLGFYIPAGEPRLIPDGAFIHGSVLERMSSVPSYRPINLPAHYNIVPMPIPPDGSADAAREPGRNPPS